MLRHVIFVLVLVGAAFAGGAAINGPGLAWLQHNLIGGPTVIVDGSRRRAAPRSRPKRFPSATRRPCSSTPAQLAPPASKAVAAAPASPRTAPPAPTWRRPPPPPPSANHDGGLAFAPPLDLPLRPQRRGGGPRLGVGPAPATRPPRPTRSRAWPRAGGLDPASAPASPGPAATGPRSASRLKALGVSRYSIDAETDGRVRFSCVIPIDGLRAVGHHFEAEGDDEFQAVEATIRRVTLWRATEPGRADP